MVHLYPSLLPNAKAYILFDSLFIKEFIKFNPTTVAWSTTTIAWSTTTVAWSTTTVAWGALPL